MTSPNARVANESADIQSRVRELESEIRQIVSRITTGAPPSRLSIMATQAAHGFTVLTVVKRLADGTWAKAVSNGRYYISGGLENVYPLTGVVTRVVGPNLFEVTTYGFVRGDHSLAIPAAAATVWFLDDATPGGLTFDTTVSQIPVLIAYPGSTDYFILPHVSRSKLIVDLGSVSSPAPTGFAVGAIVYHTLTSKVLAVAATHDTNGMGIVTARSSDGVATIAMEGWHVIASLVTQPEGALWLDPAVDGALTTTKPTADKKPRLVAWHFGNGLVLLKPADGNAGRLAGLSDVSGADAATNSQVLAFETATKLWKPATVVTLTPVAKNLVLAGPITGANAAPTFRLLDFADIPGDVSTIKLLGSTGVGSPPAYVDPVVGGAIGGTLSATTIAANAIASGNIQAHAVTPGKLAQSVAWTLIGNPSNATADNTGISATAAGQYPYCDGTVLGFGYIINSHIPKRVGISAANGDPAITGAGALTLDVASALRFYRAATTAADLIADTPGVAYMKMAWNASITAFGNSVATSALQLIDPNGSGETVMINAAGEQVWSQPSTINSVCIDNTGRVVIGGTNRNQTNAWAFKASAGGDLTIANAGVTMADYQSATTSCAYHVNGTIDASSGFKNAGVAGLTQLVALAKLTAGGGNGSMSFSGGILVSYTPPT